MFLLQIYRCNTTNKVREAQKQYACLVHNSACLVGVSGHRSSDSPGSQRYSRQELRRVPLQ